MLKQTAEVQRYIHAYTRAFAHTIHSLMLQHRLIDSTVFCHMSDFIMFTLPFYSENPSSIARHYLHNTTRFATEELLHYILINFHDSFSRRHSLFWIFYTGPHIFRNIEFSPFIFFSLAASTEFFLLVPI